MLEVGRVLRAHGLRGAVVVELYVDRPERTSAGATFSSAAGDLRIEQASRLQGRRRDRWLVCFVGIGDRDAAEALAGVALCAPALDDPEVLWVHELVGSEVVDRDGVRLGSVAAVVANPASDLLELVGGALVPLRFVVARRPGIVVVDVPDGLLDRSP